MSLFLVQKDQEGFLVKATFTIGFLFLLNTIALGYFYSKAKSASVVDSLTPSNIVQAPMVAPLDNNTTKENNTSK